MSARYIGAALRRGREACDGNAVLGFNAKNAKGVLVGMFDDLFGPGEPSSRFFDVDIHPRCPDFSAKKFSPPYELALIRLAVKLMYIAGDLEPNEAGIRLIESAQTRLQDGTYIASLCVYYEMSPNGKVALLVDAQPVEDDGVVHMSAFRDLGELLKDEVKVQLARKLV